MRITVINKYYPFQVWLFGVTAGCLTVVYKAEQGIEWLSLLWNGKFSGLSFSFKLVFFIELFPILFFYSLPTLLIFYLAFQKLTKTMTQVIKTKLILLSMVSVTLYIASYFSTIINFSIGALIDFQIVKWFLPGIILGIFVCKLQKKTQPAASFLSPHTPAE